MNCKLCSQVMVVGKYVCDTNDYRILDNNNNLVSIIQSHDIPSDDDEIGEYSDIYYCSCDYKRSYENYEKQIETEQELIKRVFENIYTTKTINDVLVKMVDAGLGTTEEIKNMLKSSNPSVTDWSF